MGRKRKPFNVVRVDLPALPFEPYYYSKLCWHILTIQNKDLLSSYYPFINKAFVKLLLISNSRIYKLPWVVWEGSQVEKWKDAFSWGSQVEWPMPRQFISDLSPRSSSSGKLLPKAHPQHWSASGSFIIHFQSVAHIFLHALNPGLWLFI